MSNHIPVLLEQSVLYIVKDVNGCYFDGTLGFGGHTELLLSKLGPKAKVLCTDKDIDAIRFCEDKFRNDNRFKPFNANFTEIDKISKIEFIDKFDGILVDLGVSSYQLDNKTSGFTYREDTYLDLRMNKNVGISAADVLNSLTQKEIANILFTYGEERKSNYIAKLIVEEREISPIKTTKQLREIVEKVVYKEKSASSLSRVFQALRIYVNNELEDLKLFLEKAIELLKPEGRIAVISYHSLEDRIVKEVFKYAALSCVCPHDIPICICNKKQTLKLVTRKPVIPAEAEIKFNKRSRSAKLRVAEKI